MRNLKYLFTILIHLPTNKADIIVPMPIPFNSPKKIKQNKEGVRNTTELVKRLKQIRDELVSIRKELDYLT